jgi:hypothetical protein
MLAFVVIATTLVIAVRPSVSPWVVPADRLVPMASHRLEAVLTAFRPVPSSDVPAPRAGKQCRPATADVHQCAPD